MTKPTLSAPRNTLAYQLARPLCTAQPSGHLDCKLVAARTKAFLSQDKDPNCNPGTSALTFYLLNHAVAEAKQRFHPLEPLPEKALSLLNSYHEQGSKLAWRSFVYLLLICTREARHLQNKSAMHAKLAKTYGDPIASYIGSIDDNAEYAMKKFPAAPPNGTIGAYCGALRQAFFEGKWGNQFGGKAWGNIADCLEKFVNGVYSPEIMLDVIWTLNHNGGPIFNKGMCFNGIYDHHLLTILDVQRAGMIPQLVHHSNVEHAFGIENYLSTFLLDAVDDLWSFAPPEKQEVDWQQVMALGAKGNYGSYIKKSKVKVPPQIKVLPPGVEKILGTFEVMPNLYVKKIKLKRAA